MKCAQKQNYTFKSCNIYRKKNEKMQLPNRNKLCFIFSISMQRKTCFLAISVCFIYCAQN